MSQQYDVTTITVRCGTHPQALKKLGERPPQGLLACWYAELGALNRILLIAKAENPAAALDARFNTLASKDPFGLGDLLVGMTMDTYAALDFLPPLAPGDLGPFYEVRQYVFKRDGVQPTIDLWREGVPGRAKVSPLLTAMVSLTGEVARFIHIWPYKSLDERARLRAKAIADKVWPPPGGPDQFKTMSSEIFMPAPFSPLR